MQQLFHNTKIMNQYEVPETLKKLLEYSNKTDGNIFNESFWLKEDYDFFDSWLDAKEVSKKGKEEFSKEIFIFASADMAGATYALWIKNDNLEEAPVLYLSDGKIYIVAENLKSFIKIFSFSIECYEGSYFHSIYDQNIDEYFANYIKNNPRFLQFREWMKASLDITPIEPYKVLESKEVNAIIEKANTLHKADFDKWQYKFYPNEDLELQKHYQEKLEQCLKKEGELLLKLAKRPDKKVFFKSISSIYVKLAENRREMPETDWSKVKQYYCKAIEYDESNSLAAEYIKKLDQIN